jgi:uncharacterized protein
MKAFEGTRVEIPCHGETVVGVLRVPEGQGPWPALVFLGPLTSVKEQVAGHYADAMARRGFAALAIDNRHFGESSGQPRHYEHPPRKVEDVRAALDWLAEQPAIDASRLGAVGVCAGAGYMAGVVAADARVLAFGAVAGFFHDASKQREWMGNRFDAAMDRARQARERYEATGDSQEIPAVGEGDVAMPLAEAFEYYGTPRGAHPNYVNAFAVMSREHTLPWDARVLAPRITVPTLMVHSEKALAPALARAFFADLGGAKADLWMESKGQIDFYDDPALIGPAADRLDAHFRAHLGA